VGVVSLAREIDFREELACRTATLLTLNSLAVMGRRSPGYAWICCPLVIASYSSGCFSGNLDWSSSVAAQQFDVSGAFGKCTKEHVKECPSRCDTSPCKRLLVRTQFLTVSAHRRYFCNVTLQWSWRVYVCDSTVVVGSCPGSNCF
jgi:hypothetical protein